MPKNGRYRKISPVYYPWPFASTLYRKRGFIRNVRFNKYDCTVPAFLSNPLEHPHHTVQIRTQYQSVKGLELSFIMTIRALMQNTKTKFRRLLLKKTELKNIGTWGKLYYNFLYRNQRSVINAMRLKGTLYWTLIKTLRTCSILLSSSRLKLRA